jgi:hypothetical protein
MTATATATTTATEKKKKRKAKLDPVVLAAIAHTQRNSVSRALALLADPPAHIPLDHLTLAGNSLISALGRCGRPHDALRALERLAEVGAPFDAFTAAAAVSACSRAASGVGTLPRTWAERGRAIYRGYVEAAEAAASAEEEAEAAAGTPPRGKTTARKKRRPIRDRPLLRALLDCGARSNVRFQFFWGEELGEKKQRNEKGGKTLSFLSLLTFPEFFPFFSTTTTRKHEQQDPEAVWAALDEYDLAGIRPGPSELASLIHSHARRSGVRPRGGESDGDGGGGGEEETDNLGGRGAASKARAAARAFLERYGDRWDPNFSSRRSMREGEEEDESSSSSEEAGEGEEGEGEGEEKRTKRKRKKKASSSPPSSESISMMTPSVYNALLRSHARAGDLDGAYAVSKPFLLWGGGVLSRGRRKKLKTNSPSLSFPLFLFSSLSR